MNDRPGRCGLVRLLLAFAALGPTASASGAAECSCRANGRDYALGETACVRTPDGGRLARCEMNLNNTSWSLTAKECVVASVALGDAVAAAALMTRHPARRLPARAEGPLEGTLDKEPGPATQPDAGGSPARSSPAYRDE